MSVAGPPGPADRRAAHRKLLAKVLAATPVPETNTVLVTHGENISGVLGLPVSQGETVVIRPDGKGGTAFVARVLASAGR